MRLESDPQMTSWIGFVSVPRDGIYAFFRSESVRTRLFVGEEDLFEWGGRLGEVGLKAGWHALRVECPARLAPAELQLAWRGPGLSKGILPAERLGHLGDKN
jgi:hypothetical protein